jgi:hypothetical protein
MRMRGAADDADQGAAANDRAAGIAEAGAGADRARARRIDQRARLGGDDAGLAQRAEGRAVALGRRAVAGDDVAVDLVLARTFALGLGHRQRHDRGGQRGGKPHHRGVALHADAAAVVERAALADARDPDGAPAGDDPHAAGDAVPGGDDLAPADGDAGAVMPGVDADHVGAERRRLALHHGAGLGGQGGKRRAQERRHKRCVYKVCAPPAYARRMYKECAAPRRRAPGIEHARPPPGAEATRKAGPGKSGMWIRSASRAATD